MSDLDALRSLIEESSRRVEDRVSEVSGKCDRLAKGHEDLACLLTGGHEPSKGVIVRLDRVEQAEESRKWWFRLMGGGVLTALLAAIKAWFSTGAGGHS